MKEWILIRHGEADHLLTGLVGGWSDSRLTGLGRSQARLTGHRLRRMLGDKPFQFYASDLARASETASIIGESIGASPVLLEELRELNNGLAAGKTKEEAKRLARPVTEPVVDWIPYPEAESWRMLHERVCRLMDKLTADPLPTTVLVTHSNTIVSMLHRWLELSREQIAKVSFDIAPCSITVLNHAHWAGSRNIAKLSETNHLESLEEATKN